MSVFGKVDLFNVGLGAATTTEARTGYGFSSAALFPQWCGRTELTNTVGAANIQRGMGGGISTTERHLISSQSQDAQAAAVTDQGAREDALIGTLTTAGAWEGYADIS